MTGGGVYLCVEPIIDDHGNNMSSATYLGDIYLQNYSVTGFLHNAIDQYLNGDLDYFYFTSSKDCVVEIFTENSPDAYLGIYDENGLSVNYDYCETENDDYKLICTIETGKFYYIEVAKFIESEYATSYTLNVKHLKDYSNMIIDEQYRVMYWYANNQDEYPEMGSSITRSLVFVSNRAKLDFEARVIEDRFSQKNGLRAVLDTGINEDILNYLLEYLISLIPLCGTSLSYAYSVGSILYNYMSRLDLIIFHSKTVEIENTDQFIICEYYYYTSNVYYDDAETGNYTYYSTGSGTYYGPDYQKGQFIETFIK